MNKQIGFSRRQMLAMSAAAAGGLAVGNREAAAQTAKRIERLTGRPAEFTQ